MLVPLFWLSDVHVWCIFFLMQKNFRKQNLNVDFIIVILTIYFIVITDENLCLLSWQFTVGCYHYV